MLRTTKDLPASMRILWDTAKTEAGHWTYAIKMNFVWDDFPEENIKDKILVEAGVYRFENENVAKIQAKRCAKEMQSYFREEIYKLIDEQEKLNFDEGR